MGVVLITGGGRGIGRATAELCIARGWDVAVSYARDAGAAGSIVAAAEAAGRQAVAVPGDVAREADVSAMFDAAAGLGPIVGVVANAGIVAPSMTLAVMQADRIRRVLDVNLLGTLLTAREAARRMARGRGGEGGSIVLVSSMASRLGAPGEYVDYAAAKAGVDALTIGLSKELGPEGVRVNAVRPGLIETEIHASGGQPDRARRLGATTPIGRAGRPEEVAEAIIWLLGGASSYVTGGFIDIAGGR